ncbi:structural maintenance of chromosomes flexible hinge domain-containing protein 1-like [Mya arenaria]|uniref:structural maintenance of chromosomes flexible hinge domain-containing protein 1-like n=1 Tax=Mya arenaria TaxID=6604 RepID=UPI0022E6109F|nr:structural maintenance of chromosomes flexible hinge domain-containing protein 1-like [Mya arenaria]XP_052765758.1 structural maintenance of chromosomes flexible hinge domain-containing protein 1-like [Mya arenaria]
MDVMAEFLTKMAAPSQAKDDGFIFVYDRREKDAPEKTISTQKILSFSDLKAKIIEEFGLKKTDKFVISTTNREEVNDNDSWDVVGSGETLYLLKNLDQELCAPARERVNYLPHYDTIVKGGMYEYYASEGQNPLPYAFAELIDNALAATRNNEGPRNIEIRVNLDESTIYVLDNGKGMTSRQLNNWAIYRLSKFIRKDKRSKVNLDETVEEEESFVEQDAPKSLNSDISYFGVGGKQAVFFIGNATRMISRPVGSKDVHELTISREEFEKKEKNHEEIYSGFIRNRKPGDAAHVSKEDETLCSLIGEEPGRDHFTAVIVQGVSKEHMLYLKEKLKEWTRQLAHIYHYYLHGPSGNVEHADENTRAPSPFKNIDIEVKLYQTRNPVPKTINLRDIDNDMQTQFVRGAASTFEFNAVIEGAKVEGVLRYHPFLYDRETYPMDPYEKPEMTLEDEHGYAVSEVPARGRRPIFECFWNGRLIPYTMIDSFEWCNPTKKSKNVPSECCNRVSGVLWTDDNFQVSTNKLTFIDLELKLRDKLASFCRVLNGQEKRTSIEKEFMGWLRECHEQFDKQIHFTEYQGQIVRLDLPKNRQTPWAAYKQVEWDGKVYKAGQMVRIVRTLPFFLGTVNRILLYGDHEGDTYATGGDLEVIQEPRSLYNEVKIVPLSKLDRTVNNQMVKKFIEDEEAKLPSELDISFPEGNRVVNNEKRKAGKPIGDIKIEIINKKGDKVKSLPGKEQANKKLLVELKVIWHAAGGDQTIVSHISQHGKNWPYWFRKMENVNYLGNYTLTLQVVLNESGENTFAGRELPGRKYKFQVVEGEAERFSVGHLEGPFRVGVPFNIPLELQDAYGNPAKIDMGKVDVKSITPVLEASGLELAYGGTSTKGHTLTIKDVEAQGQVQGNTGKNFSLTITVPELNKFAQVLKIRLLPGPASILSVSPEEELSVVNGSAPIYRVQIQDVAGNPTILEGRQSIVCKLSGAPGLPSYSLDSLSINGGNLTGESIFLKKIKSNTKLTAKFDVQGSKTIKPVERKMVVVPSGKICDMKVCYPDPDTKKQITITNGMEIIIRAGETLEVLTYKLYDEGEREVDITEKVASKIKINWLAKLNKDILMKGQLPGIKATNSVLELKYCQVSVAESSGLELGFVLKTTAWEPHGLNCTLTGSNKISIGQPLAGELLVKIIDKFGNKIDMDGKGFVNELAAHISGEGLKKELCKITYDKQLMSAIIKGIVFEGGTIGKKELQIQWKSLKDYVRLEMVAGPPAKIKFLHYNPDEELVLYNESQFPKPIVVQLLDEGENPARVADIKMQLAKDTKLKLIPTVQPTKTNKEGVADFGMYTISCSQGKYEVQPKAFISTSFVLSGPKLKISIQPDPTRPASLNVVYNTKLTLVVGQSLPEYTVTVVSEDGSPLTTAKCSHVSLKLWKSDGYDSNSLPSRTLSHNPETTKKSEAGVFHFRNIDTPEESGPYNIMFVFYDGKHQLFSSVIHTKIEPGVPVKLFALEELGTATISNSKNVNTRCIVRNLKLELRDKFNNHVTRGMNGCVNVQVSCPTDEKELPMLHGTSSKSRVLQFTLAGGSCTIQMVAIQENSPGKDGCQYELNCSVVWCDPIPVKTTLEPLCIPFLFYNDAKKQTEMAALTKERDSLVNAIKVYRSLFETSEQLIQELKISVKEMKSDENRYREELRRQKVPIASTNSVEGVEKLLKEYNEKKLEESSRKRRLCGLQTIAANDPDVLGKIGHLALISDDDAARVLSWHMSSDMDCVVTLTTKKAKEIYSMTSGRQQVLPLDSIFKKSLTEWNKPLPHVKYKPNWRPAGNPVFARNLLTFEKNQDMCKTVFSMLLGDTLWIDTLDQANNYRIELVKYTNCPTILTREGDRIRSNGKFGGLMNKAPPVEKLRGAVFGAQLPEGYHKVCSVIDTLTRLHSALQTHNTAQEELDDQLAVIQAPEMQAKYEECREVEKQLKDLEKRIGMTSPHRTVTPSLLPKIPKRTPDREEENNRSVKRLRGSPASSDSNSVTSVTPSLLTPTRQSRRLAAQSPADEGRKKLKKS